MTNYVRSPGSAFAGLAAYPFAPHYLAFEGLRLHYLDEGPRAAPVALLMHGMPTWSFLYRHMIPKLAAAGYRVIAADHIGFGKSDKVTEPGWYSIARHTAAHRALIETLDLSDITLFCQDWGGPIGLAQAAGMPQRFSRLVIMNTWLHHEGYAYTGAIRNWNKGWHAGGFFAENLPGRMGFGHLLLLATGRITQTQLIGQISGGAPLVLEGETAAIAAGYDAPFAGLGDDAYAGARRFPLSIPFDNPACGNAEAQARHFETLKAWSKPVHFIWGSGDDVFTEAWGRQWAAMFPQASFDPIAGANHFLQESHGGEVVERFLARRG